MRFMKRIVPTFFVAMALFLIACAESGSSRDGTGGNGGIGGAGGDGGGGGDNPAEFNVKIVVSADFPEVYGTVTIGIEGQEGSPIRLSKDIIWSCENPSAVFRGSKIVWSAESEKGFLWNGQIDLKQDSCLELKIDVRSMRSNLFGVYSNGTCSLPFEVMKDQEKIGIVETRWTFDPIGDLDEVNTYTMRSYVLEAARDRRAAVTGYDPEAERIPVLQGGQDCNFEFLPLGATIEMHGT